jgi:hypothetical protein
MPPTLSVYLGGEGLWLGLRAAVRAAVWVRVKIAPDGALPWLGRSSMLCFVQTFCEQLVAKVHAHNRTSFVSGIGFGRRMITRHLT